MKSGSRHGHSGYRRGCRCRVCREGRTAYMRTWREDEKNRLAQNRSKEKWRKTANGKKYHVVRERLGRQRDAGSMEYGVLLLGDPCSYCGAPANSLDHIEPVVRGGSSGWDNLTAACRNCNSSKNAKSLLGFLLTKE